MNTTSQPVESMLDFVTGRPMANTGAESNRQAVERFLVEIKGYDRKDIEVDAGISLEIDGRQYHAAIDLILRVNGFRFMVIKCAAGSLASREREVIAAARLLESYQIPLSVASDGKAALVWDTVSGKSLGKQMGAIPSKELARKSFDRATAPPLDEKRLERQKLIFRTYATQSCASKNSP